MGDTLMVLDTSYLYYRAFFGVPSSMRAPDGTPVNAIRGLLDSITRLVEMYEPDSLAAAWDDDWRPQWRTDLVPSYKAHRVTEAVPFGVDEEETPDELGVQVPLIRELLDALGIPICGVAEHEADDVLGSLAAQHNGDTLVVTGDRDLFQLISDDTSVVWVGQGVAKSVAVDAQWLHDKYGVNPERYVDFSVLRGDPSDGLPGIKGIGEKSAAKLTGVFASLDELFRAAQEGSVDISPAIRARIVESSDYLFRAEKVVKVVKDLPVSLPPKLPLRPDAAKISALAEKLGLSGPLSRLLSACG